MATPTANRDRNPRIWRMQKRGLGREQIRQRLSEGGKRDLSRQQLRALGYSPERIRQILANQAKDNNRGDGYAGAPEYPEMPQPDDPLAPPGKSTNDGKADYAQNEEDKRGESAFRVMSDLLDKYGLGTLADQLKEWIQGGDTDPATLQIRLQDTQEWKQRFAGNEMLRKQGLSVLSPAEYLNLEHAYKQALKNLPAGFHDSPEDFAKFIGNTVSPDEVKMRADAAFDLAKQVDPTQRQLLNSMYGVGEGDIAAYFLNPKKATPLLQKQLGAMQTAAGAKRAGIETNFGATGRSRFEKLNEAGVSPEMAAQGYGVIANEMDPLKNLAGIWGQSDQWNLNTAEEATFFNNDEAQRKRRRLIDAERAAFSGRSGFDSRVSGRRDAAGSF